MSAASREAARTGFGAFIRVGGVRSGERVRVSSGCRRKGSGDRGGSMGLEGGLYPRSAYDSRAYLCGRCRRSGELCLWREDGSGSSGGAGSTG